MHWVQRDQPQFGDAGHWESWARGGLFKSLGGCEEWPSKYAHKLNHQDGEHHGLLQVQKLFFETLGLLRLNMFGRLARGGSACSQVCYLLQPTGIGGYRPLLICSALDVALQLFHQCELCPILLESAFNYMWYRTNTFALTVVTLFYKYKCFLWLLISSKISISRKEYCGFPNAFM